MRWISPLALLLALGCNKTAFVVVEHTATQTFDPNGAPRIQRTSRHEKLRKETRAVALRLPPGCKGQESAECPNPEPIQAVLARKGVEVISWASLQGEGDPIAAAKAKGATMILDLHTFSFFEGPTKGVEKAHTKLIKSDGHGGDWGIPRLSPAWEASLKAQIPPVENKPLPTRQAFLEISAREPGGDKIIWLFRRIIGDKRQQRITWRQPFFCDEKGCRFFKPGTKVEQPQPTTPNPFEVKPAPAEKTPKYKMFRELAGAAVSELLSPPRL